MNFFRLHKTVHQAFTAAMSKENTPSVNYPQVVGLFRRRTHCHRNRSEAELLLILWFVLLLLFQEKIKWEAGNKCVSSQKAERF